MKKFLVLILTAATLFVSCSDDESNPIISNDDANAPSAVTDLSVAFTTGNSATLYLTATGDDGMLGRARTYEVRYSTSIIDSANYFQATSYTSPDQPNVGSADDTILVPGLLPDTKYYFAVKVADEVPNWSQISNIDSATTLLGGTWTVYKTDNSEILSNDVVDIQFDGNLKYIATLNGVSTFDNTNWDMIYESRNILIDTTTIIIGIDTIIVIDTTFLGTPNFANSIALESSTKIWLGTENSGVALIEGNSTQFYASHNSISIRSTQDILISQDKLWVGTLGTGLHSFTLDGTDVWEQFDVPTSSIIFPGFGKINCLGVDANNAIWSGLQLWGTTVYDNGTFTPNGFTDGQVLDIISSGSKVICGTNSGVFIFENNGWINYTTADGLPDNVVLTSAVDAQGTYWFGTRFGLASFDGLEWTVYTTANSYLPGNYINVLNVDMFGYLWIGTKNGLARFSN